MYAAFGSACCFSCSAARLLLALARFKRIYLYNRLYLAVFLSFFAVNVLALHILRWRTGDANLCQPKPFSPKKLTSNASSRKGFSILRKLKCAIHAWNKSNVMYTRLYVSFHYAAYICVCIIYSLLLPTSVRFIFEFNNKITRFARHTGTMRFLALSSVSIYRHVQVNGIKDA